MSSKTIHNRNKRLKNKRKQKNGIINSLSLDELLRKTEDEINVFNYEAAKTYCDCAIRKFPDDLKVLDISATLCLETNNLEGAKHCFGRAITLDPDNGHSKYFAMAQLLGGKEALQCCEKGIDILNKQIDMCLLEEAAASCTVSEDSQNSDINKGAEKPLPDLNSQVNKSKKINQKDEISNGVADDDSEDMESTTDIGEGSSSSSTSNKTQSNVPSLKRELSNAFCSIVELYTTDLCDEEKAEEKCVNFIEQSVKADETNPEAYYHQANYHCIKGNEAEAKTAILKSVSLWLPKYLSIDDGEAEAGSFDPVEVCPVSEAFRIQTSKVLIEVKECDSANDVLEGLLGEDDENVEVWYLMGWNYYLNEDESCKPASKFHLKRALEIHNESKLPDDEIVSHIKELLEELKDVESEAEEVSEDEDMDDSEEEDVDASEEEEDS